MGLETQFKSAPTFNANLMELPILQQFSQNEIATKVNTFSKGEKNIGWFLKLGVYGVAGWAAWTYILTPIAVALGQFVQLATTGILCVGLVIATPAIFAWLQNIARKIHRSAIKYAPFEELERTRAKMIANQTTFRIAKANLAMLKNDMEIEAKKSQDDAEKGQREILRLRAKAEKIKADMDAMVSAGGVEARGEDPYVDLASELQ